MTVLIAPSILASDFGRLAEQVQEAERAGADVIHIDVMDGRFVPNITIGPLIVEACRRATDLPLDVHLMIVEPERHVEAFAVAGADWLTVHAEASTHLHRTLQLIRNGGAKAGLALNPLTPLAVVRGALPELDLTLLTSVNPGFGGQSFIPATLERLGVVREWRDQLNPECRIEVDGGINIDTAGAAVAAGAELLVAGSSVFNGRSGIAQNIGDLRRAATGG
ncbi:MAG: ribulose-phosphate 3-epimerase [Trueperaceae bacterium]